METILVVGLVWCAASVPVALVVGRMMRHVAAVPQPEPVQVNATDAPASGKLTKATNY